MEKLQSDNYFKSKKKNGKGCVRKFTENEIQMSPRKHKKMLNFTLNTIGIETSLHRCVFFCSCTSASTEWAMWKEEKRSKTKG